MMKKMVYQKSNRIVLMIACICAFVIFNTMVPGITNAANNQSNYNADTLIESVKLKYTFHNWPVNNTRYDGVKINGLRFTSYRADQLDYIPGLPVTQRFLGEDGKPLFVIEINICETNELAKQKLLEYVAFVTSTKILPTLALLNIEAGDTGYAGPAPANRIAWIAFVRGNISVRILCYNPSSTPYPDMPSIAEKIDQMIVNQPQLKHKTGLSHPVITRFSAPHQQCVAGQIVPLDLHVEDPVGQPLDYKWVVGGPGQGYVEQNKEGVWQLFTTKAGNIQLTCHVLGSNGIASSDTLTLQVREK